ncbi:hypothetical protein AVEN_156674-1 [Araneus ventricosus]|uniref:Uncharacterized protein n=1 Tax=Araneus ventricosus TaxID=182803 RepID=A0A4Y2QN36_ARAVE|nr:hypothetical protein AVEN_156674-1 [Araneus ventricosus]
MFQFLFLPATVATSFIPPRFTKFSKTRGAFGDAIVCVVNDTVYDILYCFGDIRGTNHGLGEICQLHELFPGGDVVTSACELTDIMRTACDLDVVVRFLCISVFVSSIVNKRMCLKGF